MNPTPSTYTREAIGVLNQEQVDVAKPEVLYLQRNLARRQYAGEYAWRANAKPFRPSFFQDATFPEMSSFDVSLLAAEPDYRHVPRLSRLVNSRPYDVERAEFSQLFVPSGWNGRHLLYPDENAGKYYSNFEGEALGTYQQARDDLPSDLSADNSPDWMPSATAVAYLMASFYIRATRPDREGTAQEFWDRYDAQLLDDVKKESSKIGRIQNPQPVTARY